MTQKQSSVSIDVVIAEKAVKKSKTKNLHNTLRGLITFLLTQYNEGKLSVDLNPETFTWNAGTRTSMTYDHDLMSEVKDKIKAAGLASNNDFIVNLLLTNFLKND